MKQKKRLDLVLAERFTAYSRQQIQSYIMQGKVFSGQQKLEKAGMLIDPNEPLELRVEGERYVSRAGYKLEHALDHFKIDPAGLVLLDAGISTGGFTDCLLQRHARKVYGIDVGYGQLHEKIRQDPRVIVLERTNLRKLESLPEPIDMVTLDLSFISVLKVMPAINLLLKKGGILLVLIKPQFEAGKGQVGRKGVITDPKVHEQVITQVTAGIVDQGYTLQGVTESPLLGAEGNKEFLAYFMRTIA